MKIEHRQTLFKTLKRKGYFLFWSPQNSSHTIAPLSIPCFSKISFLIIYSSLILFSISPLLAQKVILQGKVLDQNTHREISGVNIFVENTDIGTSTDLEGRFSLIIPKASPEMVIIFRHIAYDPKEIPLKKVEVMRNIYLQPRVIPMKELEIEAGRRLEIEKDLPQMISIFDAKEFEIRGFVDAADLLRNEQSIQVEEELSGKKTVSIRAGNPDDVIILYNGVRMNSTYNNIFDLSLVDLEGVDHIEVIKGSNTALYGAEAFSGIINIVPQLEQNYHIKFQQRFGTYNSGNWGLHLHQGFKRFHGTYSVRQGGTQRQFLDNELLENHSLHHTANFLFDFSKKKETKEKSQLVATIIQSSQKYDDHRDNETLSNLNQVAILQFDGNIWRLKKLSISISNHKWDESQFLLNSTGTIDRNFKDRSNYLNVGKLFQFAQGEFLFKYQIENAILDFQDKRILSVDQSVGLESATFVRQREGFVSILKFHTPTNSNTVTITDFDISFRYDNVIDSEHNPITRGGLQISQVGLFNKNNWSQTTFRLSTHFSGGKENRLFEAYMNYGTNIKFPSLFQQVSSPKIDTTIIGRPNLDPEKNTGLEMGIKLAGDIRNQPVLYGYQISGSLFRNDYENKLRISFPVGIPVAFYDNVLQAKLSGFESTWQIYLFHRKVTFDIGASLYSISEKAAFPFKSNLKLTSNLIIDHAGYSFQLHAFKESEQVGSIREKDGTFIEVVLPEYTNLDFHLSKTFDWHKLKLFVNASGRNVLHRKMMLQGLAIRDPRYYITIGIQY